MTMLLTQPCPRLARRSLLSLLPLPLLPATGSPAAAAPSPVPALLDAAFAARELDYRLCVRAVLADAASGGLNGSLRLPAELVAPENAGLAPTVAAVEAVRAAVAQETGLAVSFADALVAAARSRTKVAFDARLVARGATPEKGAVLLKAYANAFDSPRLGRVDAAEASPSLLPLPCAPVAQWRQAFTALGLGTAELALLGPDVVGAASEAEAEALLREDPAVAAALDGLVLAKGLLTRTPYEMPYMRALLRLGERGTVRQKST